MVKRTGRSTPTGSRKTAPRGRVSKAKKPLTTGLASGGRYEKLRRLAEDYPEIEEGTSYGTAALKVRGTLLVRLKEDGETIVLKTTFVDRDLLMQADPEVYFITDHYRDYPYVLVRLSRISLDDLRDRLEEALQRLTK
jgi:hypothetical protein